MKRNIIINNEVLRVTRKLKGITQEYMAEYLGVTRKTYARYEKERAYMSRDTVERIAQKLNVEQDALILLDMDKEIERITNYPLDKLRGRMSRKTNDV